MGPENSGLSSGSVTSARAAIHLDYKLALLAPEYFGLCGTVEVRAENDRIFCAYAANICIGRTEEKDKKVAAGEHGLDIYKKCSMYMYVPHFYPVEPLDIPCLPPRHIKWKTHPTAGKDERYSDSHDSIVLPVARKVLRRPC
jgi:hypothetical protein